MELISGKYIRAITLSYSDNSTRLIDSRLVYAATFGLTRIVNRLLKEGADVNETNHTGITALMNAADSGYVDTVRVLLDAQADVNKASEGDITALMKAASNGHDEIVQILLYHEADIEAVTRSGETSLILAAKNGFASTVRLLVDNSANMDAGSGILQAAIRTGRTEMVELAASQIKKLTKAHDMENTLAEVLKLEIPSSIEIPSLTAIFELLIAKGANPTGSENGETPIHVAASYGNVEAVRSLLKLGVSPNTRDKDRRAPIHSAAFSGNHEIIDLLVDHGADLTAQNHAGESVLHILTRSEFDKNLVSLLMRRGVPVNTPDAEGKTALHIAARKGSVSTAKFLMEHGADGSRKDHGGRTPLEIAAVSGNEEFVEQILATPCPPHLTPLLAGARLRNALSENNTVVVNETLTIPDIDVNAPDYLGRTPLHFAAFNGQENIVESLLARGALVNVRRARTDPDHKSFLCQTIHQQFGSTPLHIAAGKGHTGVVELLLKHGADLDAPDDHGYKAFFTAAKKGHANVIKLLLESGSQVSESPEGGATPLYASVMSFHAGVIRLLLENGADAERDTDWGKRALAAAISRKRAAFRTRVTSPKRAGIIELLRKHGFTTPEE
ncbi:MAG: hypothetical protein Q9196_004919 [Gyalolechia fulgens]